MNAEPAIAATGDDLAVQHASAELSQINQLLQCDAFTGYFARRVRERIHEIEAELIATAGPEALPALRSERRALDWVLKFPREAQGAHKKTLNA